MAGDQSEKETWMSRKKTLAYLRYLQSSYIVGFGQFSRQIAAVFVRSANPENRQNNNLDSDRKVKYISRSICD